MANGASPGISGRGTRVVAGRYRLTEVLGRGGMGTVWRAVDETLHRDVAVKELRLPDYLDDEEREIQQQRTLREARTAARITHENVVTIHDVVEDSGIPWIVMELVEAESLADVIKNRGTLTPTDAAEIGLRVLYALVAAEQKGVLHRDVKPANILVTVHGRVVLTDFGIATEAGAQTLTATGMLVGSPNFLAPERASGLRPELAADLWSLGLVMYMAVEGRNPFDRPTMISTLNSILTEDPDPPRRAGTLAVVIDGLLQKDPEYRLPAKEVERLLLGVVRGELTQAHPSAVPPHVPSAPGPAPVADSGPPPQMSAATTFVPANRQTATSGSGPGSVPGSAPGAMSTAVPDSAPPHAGYAAGPYAPPPAHLGPQYPPISFVLRGNGVDKGDKGYAYAGGPSPTLQQQGQSQPTGPSPSISANTGAPTTIPGYTWTVDEAGFSMFVPNGWSRTQSGAQVDYTDPRGKTLLRIGIDNGGAAPLDNFTTIDANFAKIKQNYKTVQLDPYPLRAGWQEAAVWEITWNGNPFNPESPALKPSHAIDLGFRTAKGGDFAIYVAAFEADWSTAKAVYDTIIPTFREN
ncbi:MAG: protein kinase [Streptomycetaceae bacterium]|nr:protein kinase [Streptomycetaceae bacterium]